MEKEGRVLRREDRWREVGLVIGEKEEQLEMR
jgi:hypothetical protein